MAFRIEISYNNKVLNFGPRYPGQVGRDILAVKVALGLIKKLDENNVVMGDPSGQEVPLDTQVPFDTQEWFDCQTGLGTDLETASRFDLNMETFLNAYQIKNKFLIICYLFEKFAVRDLLEGKSDAKPTDPEEYSKSVIQQVVAAETLFEAEFGTLGEATLAVMHGWRPQSRISSKGYSHNPLVHTRPDEAVIDIVPEEIYKTHLNAAGRQRMVDEGYFFTVNREGQDIGPIARRNYLPSLQEFKRKAGSLSGWIDEDNSVKFHYYALSYKFHPDSPSLLYNAAATVMEFTEDFSNPSLIDRETKNDRLKSFFYPDAFSTEDPFIIDDKTIGFFYETEFELSAQGPLPQETAQEISELEDKALQQVLDYYGKPEIWNFSVGDSAFTSTYLLGNLDLRPEHADLFPRQIDSERVRNSDAYRLIQLKIDLLRSQISRLEERKTPSASNRHNDMDDFILRINEKISAVETEIETLESEKARLETGEGLRRKDFWVFSTLETAEKLAPNATQSWRAAELPGADPLISFVEYRTPPLRPGVKYRALMQVDREKLDLIIHGDPIQQRQTQQPAGGTGEQPVTDQIQVCENLDPNEARRQREEMRAHARKRRRELARALKEKVQETRRVENARTSVDLGVYGPFNLNKTFPGIRGLSGLSDEEYTKEAIKLLTTNGSSILEAWNWFDTPSEDLQDQIDKINALSSTSAQDSEEETKKKSDRLNNIVTMHLVELRERVKNAAKDLKESAAVIEKESIRFIRGSNFNANNEAQQLQRAMTQLEEFMSLDSNWQGTGVANGPKNLKELIDSVGESNVVVKIHFQPTSYLGLGAKNGKFIRRITLMSQDQNALGFDSGPPKKVMDVPFVDSVTAASTLGVADEALLNKYEPLNRARTVNYLSYIYEMTNPYPSSFSEFIGSWWDDKRSVCAELGINSEKGLAISLVGSYTSGIEADLEDDDELTDAFVNWAKENFVDPAKKWLKTSADNARSSIDDTFDEEQALKAFGRLCTLEDLYDEFFDKLDLKSLLCDYLKCIGLPAFELKLPSFYLPPWPKIPIIGWYGYLVKFLYDEFKQILIRILCTFARTIIDKLAFPFCEEQLQDFIAAGSSATPIMNQALAEALTNTGITSGNQEKAKTFFDDVTKLTTAQELCHLLNGKPLDDAGMLILRRLAQRVGLDADLSTNEDIANYFGVLGAYIPFEICDQLSQLPTANQPSGATSDAEKCEEIIDALKAIRNRLQTGDSSLTDEEISRVLDLAQKNLDDRQSELAALSGGNVNAALPPQFRFNPNDQSTKGLVGSINNAMPSFLTDTISNTAKSLFQPAKSSYISALSDYVASMKVQAPESPTASDPDYNFDAVLKMETALEQLKNYAQAISSEAPPEAPTSAELAEASGLFEEAKRYGLGDWRAISDQMSRGNAPDNYNSLLFLDPARNIDDEAVRIENQSMILELVKSEIKNTLKVKQIISAFTVFEHMGHSPLRSYIKWKEYHQIDAIEDVELRQSMRDHNLHDWWKVTPGRYGNSSKQEVEEFLDWWKDLNPNNEHKLNTKAEFQRDSIAQFYEATEIITDMPWFRAYAGVRHPEPFPHQQERLQKIHGIIGGDDYRKKKSLFSSFMRELDKITFCMDLELINHEDDDDPPDQAGHFYDSANPYGPSNYGFYYGMASFARRDFRRFRYGRLTKYGNLRASLYRKAAHEGDPQDRIDQFLKEAVELLYADNPDPTASYDLFGDNEKIIYKNDNLEQPIFREDLDLGIELGVWRPRNIRTKFFGHIKGTPLFLTAPNDKRVLLPIEEFGSRITTDPDHLMDNTSTNGSDIYLPSEKGHFRATFPFSYYGTKYSLQGDKALDRGENNLVFPDGVPGLSPLPANCMLFKTEQFLHDVLAGGTLFSERERMKEIIGHPFSEAIVWNKNDLVYLFNQNIDGALFPAINVDSEEGLVRACLASDFISLYGDDSTRSLAQTIGDSKIHFTGRGAANGQELCKNFVTLPIRFSPLSPGNAKIIFPRAEIMPSRVVASRYKDRITLHAGVRANYNSDGVQFHRTYPENATPEEKNGDNYYSLYKFDWFETPPGKWNTIPRTFGPDLYLWDPAFEKSKFNNYNLDEKYPILSEVNLYNDIGNPDLVSQIDRETGRNYKRLLAATSLQTDKLLYMKIVQTMSAKTVTYQDNGDVVIIPLVDEYCLKSFVMPYLKRRMETLEQAMIQYGTKEAESFESAFEGIIHASPFSGNQAESSISITPSHAKLLFQLYEIEEKRAFDTTNLVHKRYYRTDPEDPSTEVAISYERFIEITRDPLGTEWPLDKDGNKVEFYFKPLKFSDSDQEFFLKPEEDMSILVAALGEAVERRPMPEEMPKFIFDETSEYQKEIVSKDRFYVDGPLSSASEAAKSRIKANSERTLRTLMLDSDNDSMLELANLTNPGNERAVRQVYENNPLLLEIVSDRVNHLSGIIVDSMQNLESNFVYNLLPTISSVFGMIKRSHINVGSNLNAVFNSLGNRLNEKVGNQIGLKFAIGPYTPGIKQVDYDVKGYSFDRYNIVVDSDVNLNLGFNQALTTSPISRHPDFKGAEQLDGVDTPSRKIFQFCDTLPKSIRDTLRAEEESFLSEIPSQPKRAAFAKMVIEKILEHNLIPNSEDETQPDLGYVSSTLKSSLEGEIYDEVTSNLMNMLASSLEKSPLFDEDYTDKLEARISGRPIVNTTQNGSCVSNRYSLSAGSILSFDKVIIGDAFKEVMAEMSKPENSPFNRDINKPEPFDKAMLSVSVKAFIRACMVDLLLKGGIAFSVWDIEPIVSTPLYLNYVIEHVRRELDNSKLLKNVWPRALERSEGLSSRSAALEAVVREEILKFPQYSKQIFHPSVVGRDFYNWYIYGKTLLDWETDRPENDFFTKEGIIYRMPVPNWEMGPNPFNGGRAAINLFGKSHLGNLDLDDASKFYGSHREFPKDSQRIIDDGIFSRSKDSFPTAKLIYEDYFLCSGPILRYFKGILKEDEAKVNPSDARIFSYEEFSFAMENLFSKGALETPAGFDEPLQDPKPTDPDEILELSQIKIGKRLTLLLNSGAKTTESGSKIEEIIDKIRSEELNSQNKVAASKKHRAFMLEKQPGMVTNEDLIPFQKFASIPLTSYEKDLSKEDCYAVRRFLQAKPISPENMFAAPPEFYLRLSQDFSETQGFKDYLDHIFPVRRFMAMTSIFSSSVLGGFNDLPTIMDATKSMIAFVGLAASTPANQRGDLISLDQAEFQKQIKQSFPGDPDDAKCFDFPGISGDFFSAFWEELKRLMKYFPSILFRGIANQLDPAYKEMRAHYLNCDIRNLNWKGTTHISKKDKLATGLRGVSEPGTGQDGKYASILTAMPADFGYGIYRLFTLGNVDARFLEAAILKTVTYAYSGGLPFLDLARSFKIPCIDYDAKWDEGQEYDVGRYGRYGHPLSPFTALALSTLQLPADKEKRESNCRVRDPDTNDQTALPSDDCDDVLEEAQNDEDNS